MQLDYHILDVFTDQPFTGNPLAVVLGADGLEDWQMQTIARQFNLSETIFVQTPEDPAHAAKVRIFLPLAEIPFAGHPTIGCAVLLAGLRGIAGPLILEERAGLVPVTLGDGAVPMAEFTAPVVPFAAAAVPDAGLVAAALGLPQLRSVALCEGGSRFLFPEVATLEALAAARPQEPAWSDLGRADAPGKMWVWCRTGARSVRARMFAPGAGVPEDPATGSATAVFAAVLHGQGALDEGETVFTIDQGVEMGRPSRLRLTAVVQDGALVAARVAGPAVRVAEGRIRVPERRG
ncbi:MAG: PhzF family phenazine biosynthesis protein [Rhodobacterales bacterium]|nr:PhzF family phenazine biosynthesis protein [Rhodobacterales bacterium]MDX5501402.1 PhzF family phenazine biosynthesis protein [Rhodobacterales bacterium]